MRDGVLVQHELPSEGCGEHASDEREVRGGDAGPEAAARRRRAVARGRHGARSRLPQWGSEAPSTNATGRSVTRPCRFRAGSVPTVSAHLAGEPTSYEDVQLDVDWATPLQRELVAAARAIPWGEVVSYGELAALAGRPGAARAAGSFCAENRYSLIIPCHRVVAANGIGGYGSAGPELKRRLLALEGVEL